MKKSFFFISLWKKNFVYLIPGSLLLFSLLVFIHPDQEFLEMENRKASRLPEFNFENISNSTLGSSIDVYFSDQFFFRDNWIQLKSFINQVLFRKKEEGGILLGKEGWLFTKQFFSREEASYFKNIMAVEEFAVQCQVPVSFMMIPSAAFVYSDKLPEGAPMLDEDKYFDWLMERDVSNLNKIDLRDLLKRNKEQGLYYKTDHHWNTRGAYYAYQLFCQKKGLADFDWEKREKKRISDFYGTHYIKSRAWNVNSDQIFYYPTENLMTVYRIKGEAEVEPSKKTKTVDAEKFKTVDKYGAFLGGNNGYSVIEGEGEGKILLVKDSYGNSFANLLIPNYEKIGIVDCRNYAYGLKSLIEKEGYEEVLILYSFQSLWQDSKIVFINRPSLITGET